MAVQFEIQTLHPALGAQVVGLSLAEPMDDETFQAIRDAWMDHLVLVFPNQTLSDEQQIAFSQRFGVLEEHHQAIIKSRTSPHVFRVSNVDDDGNLMSANHPLVAQISLAQRWHTDSSYRTVPSMGSILHGIEVTKEGGETCFTNMYMVYDALDPVIKQSIAGCRARHDFGHLTKLAPVKPLTKEERQAMPPVWQPMVRKHPWTGRPSLFISPIYNDAIESMNDEKAAELLTELTDFAGREEFVYRHSWTSGDVVMWDNRCTMHRVTPYDLNLRRVMHRNTVVGDGPVMAA